MTTNSSGSLTAHIPDGDSAFNKLILPAPAVSVAIIHNSDWAVGTNWGLHGFSYNTIYGHSSRPQIHVHPFQLTPMRLDHHHDFVLFLCMCCSNQQGPSLEGYINLFKPSLCLEVFDIGPLFRCHQFSDCWYEQRSTKHCDPWQHRGKRDSHLGCRCATAKFQHHYGVCAGMRA